MDIQSYGSTMGRVNPGTFVPDIAAPGAPASEPLSSGDVSTAGSSFRDTLSTLLGGVNDKMTDASQMSQDLATGKSNDFNGTIKSVEEASLAFQFTMAVRNKLMDAYTEIQQTQM
jgi:flagellar hook-basal body complex protein FliE